LVDKFRWIAKSWLGGREKKTAGSSRSVYHVTENRPFIYVSAVGGAVDVGMSLVVIMHGMHQQMIWQNGNQATTQDPEHASASSAGACRSHDAIQAYLEHFG